MRLFEMVQLLLLPWMLIPATAMPPVPKKSKMLLSLITLPVLALGLADPSPMIPLIGRLAPGGPILFFEIVLLLLPPVTVEVLKSTVPPAVVVEEVDDPRIVQ